MNPKDYADLEGRIGRSHLRQRLGVESDHEAQLFGQGITFFHLENWYSIHGVIRGCLRLVGLHGRGRRNALDIQVRHHDIALPDLPPAFHGVRILQLSDLHLDMNDETVHAQIETVRDIDYDLCVLTGDYRARTFGECGGATQGMERLRLHLKDPVYGVLGNHDSIRLVPGFEALGIRMLLNESVVLERDGQRIWLAGIDDAHYYRVDNLEKAARDVPHAAVCVLLSHTPEVYARAAHAGFRVLLCGHTHGGQICLPGRVALLWEAKCPRHLVSGPWRYHNMIGYTSVGAGTCIVDVRLNCPPEVTVHRLLRAD